MSNSKDNKMEINKDVPTSSTRSGNEIKKRFEVIQWNTIALWTWDVNVDICAICRNKVSESCVKCQMDEEASPDQCTVSFGVCAHGFHRHCISRWIQTRNVCPLDNNEWETMEDGY